MFMLCGVFYVDCAVLQVTPRLLVPESCIHIDSYVVVQLLVMLLLYW